VLAFIDQIGLVSPSSFHVMTVTDPLGGENVALLLDKMQNFRFSQRRKWIFRSSGIECLVDRQIATEFAEEPNVS